MGKKKIRKDSLTDDAEFWVVLEYKNSIASIGNVGGNRFVLVFTTERKARNFHRDTPRKLVKTHYDTPVRKKTWSEILRMSGGDRRRVYFHFDLPPNPKEIVHKNIICIEP